MKKILSIILVALLLLPIAAFVSCGAPSAPRGTYTRITFDINPSVELMVNDKGKVVAVTALNDDGSILIAGEDIIGKTPEEATELLVKVSADTGYLIKGNMSASENSVKISVSGDSEYADNLRQSIEAKAKEALDGLDIIGKVTRIKAAKIAELRAYVSDQALFDQDEVAEMDEKQLLAALAADRTETALLLTENMRSVYYSAREHRISYAERQATAEIINAMGGTYQLIYAAYKTAVDAYSASVDAIDGFRYKMLLSPDSEYQRSLSKLREAKTELLAQKNHIASLGVGSEEYMSASAALRICEEQYDKMLAAYEAVGDSLNERLAALVESLRKAEETLISIESKFSNSVKEELAAKAHKLENAVNDAKDSFFEQFEKEHAEDIAAAEQALKDQKNKLREAALGTK